MVDNDIIYIKDLMKTDKSFYTYTELCNKINIAVILMSYNLIVCYPPFRG